MSKIMSFIFIVLFYLEVIGICSNIKPPHSIAQKKMINRNQDELCISYDSVLFNGIYLMNTSSLKKELTISLSENILIPDITLKSKYSSGIDTLLKSIVQRDKTYSNKFLNILINSRKGIFKKKRLAIKMDKYLECVILFFILEKTIVIGYEEVYLITKNKFSQKESYIKLTNLKRK